MRGSEEPWPASTWRQVLWRLRPGDLTGGALGPWDCRRPGQHGVAAATLGLDRGCPEPATVEKAGGGVPEALTASPRTAGCPRGRGQRLRGTEAAGASLLTQGALGSLPDLTAADRVDTVTTFPPAPHFCSPRPSPGSGRGGPDRETAKATQLGGGPGVSAGPASRAQHGRGGVRAWVHGHLWLGRFLQEDTAGRKQPVGPWHGGRFLRPQCTLRAPLLQPAWGPGAHPGVASLGGSRRPSGKRSLLEVTQQPGGTSTASPLPAPQRGAHGPPWGWASQSSVADSSRIPWPPPSPPRPPARRRGLTWRLDELTVLGAARPGALGPGLVAALLAVSLGQPRLGVDAPDQAPLHAPAAGG